MTADNNEDTPLPPEINKYLTILSRDPKSIVFAPLAEAYRKAGMLDEAIATAKDGLQSHPNYLGGLVALGRAYFEKGMLEEAREDLEKVVKIAPDNIIASGILDEIRNRSEVKAMEREAPINPAAPGISDSVRQGELDNEIIEEIEPIDLAEIAEEEDFLGAGEEPEVSRKEYVEPEFIADVSEISDDIEEEDIIEEEGSEPKNDITTETIAELYIKQGYIDRARVIYQALYDADPGNEEIKKRLDWLQKEGDKKEEDQEPESLETGQKPLNPEVPGGETSIPGTEVELRLTQSSTVPEEIDSGEIGADDNVKRLESWLKNIQNERHRG